jgi:hypothetical protein
MEPGSLGDSRSRKPQLRKLSGSGRLSNLLPLQFPLDPAAEMSHSVAAVAFFTCLVALASAQAPTPYVHVSTFAAQTCSGQVQVFDTYPVGSCIQTGPAQSLSVNCGSGATGMVCVSFLILLFFCFFFPFLIWLLSLQNQLLQHFRLLCFWRQRFASRPGHLQQRVPRDQLYLRLRHLRFDRHSRPELCGPLLLG